LGKSAAAAAAGVHSPQSEKHHKIDSVDFESNEPKFLANLNQSHPKAPQAATPQNTSSETESKCLSDFVRICRKWTFFNTSLNICKTKRRRLPAKITVATLNYYVTDFWHHRE